MADFTLAAPNTLAAITIMGSGRLGPTITALVGITAAVLGARRLVRTTRPAETTSSVLHDQGRVALMLGIFAIVVGGVLLAAADGGPGTGNGVVASAAAIVFGVVAIGLDRLAATRHHR